MNESEFEIYFWLLFPLGAIYILFILRLMYYLYVLNHNVKKKMGHDYYIKRPTVEGKKEIKNFIKETPELLTIQKKATQAWKYGLLYMIFLPFFAYTFFTVATLE